MKSIKRLMKWSGFFIAALALSAAHSSSGTEGAQQSVVDGAVTALTELSSAPEFKKHINQARGLLIVPSVMKSGGGNGVMLSRVSGSRKWSYPAFYSVSSSSYGLQANKSGNAIVLMIMNDNAMDILLSGTARAGKEVSIAAGSAADAGVDVLQFPVMSMAEPDSLTVTGATISVLKKWNQEYYGRMVSVTDILVDHQVQIAGADSLRRAVAGTLSR